jgi:hypothetical protein
MNKLLSSDQIINDRTVLSEIRTAANMIAGQSLKKRECWNSPTLFTPIPCLQMEEVPLSECCEYTNPCTIAKSTQPLPKIGEGLFGLAIQGVFSLDNKRKLVKITPDQYVDILKLNLPDRNVYFWIQNWYLYVTNPKTRAVNLFAFFTEMVPNELLFPGEDCDCKIKPSIESLCTNPLDQEFHFIEDRMFDLKQLVYKNLLSTYFNLAVDKTSDNKDDTSK